jgi:hypothetical protein
LGFAGIALELRLIVRFGMADQGCRPAEVADIRLTSLTLAALTFNSLASIPNSIRPDGVEVSRACWWR